MLSSYWAKPLLATFVTITNPEIVVLGIEPPPRNAPLEKSPCGSGTSTSACPLRLAGAVASRVIVNASPLPGPLTSLIWAATRLDEPHVNFHTSTHSLLPHSSVPDLTAALAGSNRRAAIARAAQRSSESCHRQSPFSVRRVGHRMPRCNGTAVDAPFARA